MFVSSFHRPNLHLAAAPKIGETAQLLEFLHATRANAASSIAAAAQKPSASPRSSNEKGFPALPFHAGLDPQLKRDSLKRFRSG